MASSTSWRREGHRPFPSRAGPSRLVLAALLVALSTQVASADAPPPPGDAHLVYGWLCAADPARAIRVTIVATPKGPQVTLVRNGADPGPFETRDVNFAHVSRRLFFKARTSQGLIEFQGRALAAELTGLYSDDRGETRTISLPDASRAPACEDRR